MAQELNLLRPRQFSPPALIQRVLHKSFKVTEPGHFFEGWGQREPRFKGPAQWLALHGKPMYQGLRQPESRDNHMCWMNSFLMRYKRSDFHIDYAYAEGFVVRPVERENRVGFAGEIHAWNMRRGHVYDTTYGFAPEARYLGVAFTDEFLRFATFMTGYGMSFLLQFDLLWPYLDNYAARDWRLITKG